jgi:predicted metal-dependent phosphoesterase TrpH
MVDLHSHTDESDGTCAPADLLHEAKRAGVRVLAITDHDTFAGYDRARLLVGANLELVCGIELSTKLGPQTVHLLGYFLCGNAPAGFREWVLELQASRRDRNCRLVARLRDLGLDITLEEAEARGRGMTGRPHFAQILKEKGYVATLQQAFDDYLDESARGYVDRKEPQVGAAIARIRDAGGIASLAHPIRIKGGIDAVLPELCLSGLNAIEAYHSDQSATQTNELLDRARFHGLMVTGGSDYHGATKPGLELGTGYGKSLRIPADLLDRLRITGL